MHDQTAATPAPGSRSDPAGWTTRRLLAWMAERFGASGLEAPRLQAECLLASVLGCERIRLYMEADRPASEDERARLRDLVRRLAAGEPLQLVTGVADFRGRSFRCGPCTQIPQPCTGELVDAVLETLPAAGRGGDGPGLAVLDLGCGTGVVGLTILAERPGATATLVDVDTAALALAKANAEAIDVAGRATVLEGDLDAPVPDGARFEAVVGNLPYIPDDEWDGGRVDPGVRRHVAARALRGGDDGLDVVRRAVDLAPDRLGPGGVLALECADASAEALAALVKGGPFDEVTIRRDEDDLRRAVVARRR